MLKIFTAEFYSIGALFATYGAGILLVSMYRRYEGNRQFFVLRKPAVPLIPPPHAPDARPNARPAPALADNLEEEIEKKFRTSGNAVVILTALSCAAYTSLIVLTIRLKG